MNRNSKAIIILCSHLCVGENIKPFEPSEWSKFADRLIDLQLSPCDLLKMDSVNLKNYFTDTESERIMNLVNRSAGISFELSKYAEQGINVVTRADSEYPALLKLKLKKTCPPLFYYIGDLSICNRSFIGFVGSRKIDVSDEEFTKTTVKKALQKGYGIVSGGAKGIDNISVDTAIENNGYVVEYISDSLDKKIKKKNIIQPLRDRQLVILSTAKPDAGFNTGMAMARNKYIYSQSKASIVVRSEYNKGGTWSGANEAIKKDYCRVLCWDNNAYLGNAEIIKNGAIGIDENWNGRIPSEKEIHEQLSLF